MKLQQYLPLAVLKLSKALLTTKQYLSVATVLTACGIETSAAPLNRGVTSTTLQQYLPLAVLKPKELKPLNFAFLVATVLTACGIETFKRLHVNYINKLQQYLPLAVLKHAH